MKSTNGKNENKNTTANETKKERLTKKEQITNLANTKCEKVTPEEVKKAFTNGKALFLEGKKRILKEQPTNAHPDQYIYVGGELLRTCNAAFYPNGVKPETKNTRAKGVKVTFTERVNEILTALNKYIEDNGVKVKKGARIEIIAAAVDAHIKEVDEKTEKQKAEKHTEKVNKKLEKCTLEEIENYLQMKKAAAAV